MVPEENGDADKPLEIVESDPELIEVVNNQQQSKPKKLKLKQKLQAAHKGTIYFWWSRLKTFYFWRSQKTSMVPR